VEEIWFNFHFAKFKDKIVQLKESNSSAALHVSHEYLINKTILENYEGYKCLTIKISRSKERDQEEKIKKKKAKKTRKIKRRCTHRRNYKDVYTVVIHFKETVLLSTYIAYQPPLVAPG